MDPKLIYVLILITGHIFSQSNILNDLSPSNEFTTKYMFNNNTSGPGLTYQNTDVNKYKVFNKSADDPPNYLIAGVILCNIIGLYENHKFYFGITREASLGFGENPMFRLSIEYSYIIRDSLTDQFRISTKCDLLEKKKYKTSGFNRRVLTFGAGYFIDKEGTGIYPELTTGYRLTDKEDMNSIVQLYLSLRHTFMLKSNKSDITDFSAGVILGYRIY